jgi:hypothetical protein
MLLAGILALCMPPCVPQGHASGVAVSAFADDSTPPAQQTSSQTGSSSAPTSNGQQASPPASSKPTPTSKPKHKKKPVQSSADSPNDAPPKKVVTHGSTQTPTTHLAPGMTDEESAKSRAANADLLNQAGANLQKINGRTLTSEQQETQEQVRKFVEQSKAADQEGDLQRAGTLANKAKLLSDSLEETTRPK